MRRNGIARLCMYAALAATVAVTLGGCSGGLSSADNGAGAPAATTAPTATTPPTAAGALLQKNAAAAPATTNTADNPTQSFGLVAGAGLPVVAVNSPPVVNFAVIDANGNHVPGLTLFNASGATVDPNCTGNNVSFAIAKWDTTTYSQGVWQNLISLQRLAADVPAFTNTRTNVTSTKYSVVEGTTDPKPTATLTNPATVAVTIDKSTGKATVADQGNQLVGILTENATEGYYTYVFGTDVSTSLLMANAVAGKVVASTKASATNPAMANKVANNGKLAVKDGKTIHRLGAQLCYTDPVSKAKVTVNPYIDFTLAADGTATPVTVSATDKTLKPYRRVVDKASCNDCHKQLALHGGRRVDPNYCVMCHNPGSTDYGTNNPIDLKLMVHKIHRGESLTKSYSVQSLVAYDATTGSGIAYPQDIRNCVKCHGGSTSVARFPTADGDNWMGAPSRNACGACHDGIDFATGTGTTIKKATTGHGGGAQGSDSGCSTCHAAAYVASKHTLPSANDASQRKMSANITKAVVDATTGKVTVTFTMTKAGDAVTNTTDFVLAEMTLAKLVTPGKGSPSHWQSYTGKFRTTDPAKPLVIQGYSETANATAVAALKPLVTGLSAGTLTNVGSGVYTYTFALPHADTPGDIRTITKFFDLTTPSTSATSPLFGYVRKGLQSTASWADTSYDANATHRVGMIFTEASTSKDSSGAVIKNHDNATFDFVPSGKAAATPATRNIIDMQTCRDGCHSDWLIHKGYNTNICVTCHTETTYDPDTGLNPVPVDLKFMVHRIHMGENLPSVVQGTPYTVGGASHDFSDVAFPQSPVSNCLACHLPATVVGKSDAINKTEATNWKMVPSRRACGACHDGINFATGGGSTLKDISTWLAAKALDYKVTLATLATSTHAGGAQVDDSRCATCHDAGSVSLYHIK